MIYIVHILIKCTYVECGKVRSLSFVFDFMLCYTENQLKFLERETNLTIKKGEYTKCRGN